MPTTRQGEDQEEDPSAKDRELRAGAPAADAAPQAEETAPHTVPERPTAAAPDPPAVAAAAPAAAPMPQQPPAAEDEEQNLYAPPMSPQKLESIQKWVDSLPSPSEVAKDVLENPVIHEVQDGTASEQSSSGRDGGADDRRSSLTAEHLKHHTKVLSTNGKGRGTPVSPGMHETFHSDAAQVPVNGEQSASSPTQAASQPQASFMLGAAT
eukprot:EG_transcript_16190